MSPPLHHQTRRGFVLGLVMILIVVMALGVLAVSSYVGTAAKIEARDEAHLLASKAAEAATEEDIAQLSALADSIRPTVPSLAQVTNLCNLSTAPSSIYPSSAGFSYVANIAVPVENGVAVNAFTKLSYDTLTFRYLVASEATYSVPGMDPVHARMQREFIHRVIPLFQYAIFYNDTLELDPGADFTVEGRVHSNDKFYYGSFSTLTFQGYVTTVNGASNTANPLDPHATDYGSNVVFANGPPPQNPLIVTTIRVPASIKDPTGANHNQEGPRELIEIPDLTQSDPNNLERLYTKAGLKIFLNTDVVDHSVMGITVPASGHGIVLLTKDGIQIPRMDVPTNSKINPIYQKLESLLDLTAQIKDYRQNNDSGGTIIYTAALNVSDLTSAVESTPTDVGITVTNNADYGPAAGKNLWNGIVYIYDAAISVHPVGIKLYNGAMLPSIADAEVAPGGGLTIVTDHPVFVVGNYNTGGNPPVNSGATTDDNFVGGYTVKPAAIMGDAVTLLSANWDAGAYNNQPLGGRTPENTTFNAAVLSGNVPSTPSGIDPHYSGGAENFPRLLENWTGFRLTYYGSMICLYPSKEANSKWITTGNYYSAPNRNWHFDKNFKNPNLLPPGTPSAVVFSQGQWVQMK